MHLWASYFHSHSWAQEDKSKRPSPPATAAGKIRSSTITISYSSPSVKGRKIFGGLVPYGQVWRAGANEATIFSTDKDIEVEGKKLPAGKYSLFMTPGEKEWTFFSILKPANGVIAKGRNCKYGSIENSSAGNRKTEECKDVQEKLIYTIFDKRF